MLSLLLAATLAAAEPAATDAHTAAALKMIEASRADEPLKMLKDPTAPMVQSTVAQFQGCASAKPVLDDFSKRMGAITFSDAEIGEMRKDFAAVYTDVFTQQELETMTAFFTSDLGKKLLDKTPEIMQRIQGASQQRMQASMENAQKIGQELAPKLDEAFRACQAAQGEKPAN